MAVLTACSSPAAQATPTLTPAPTPSPSPTPSPALPGLSALALAGKTATYKVTYKVSTKSAAGSVEGITQIWYVKPSKLRIDSFILSPGPTPDTSIFVLDTGTYVCSAQTGSLQCITMPAQQAAAARQPLQVQDTLVSGSSDVVVQPSGTRTIAGTQAFCFDATHAPTGSKGTLCYTAQGVPLFIAYSAAGTESTLEATAFSTTVSDDDLKLPVAPQ